MQSKEDLQQIYRQAVLINIISQPTDPIQYDVDSITCL